MNKASGGDGTPSELLQILKDEAVKALLSVCQQIWKTQQWPREWKRSAFTPIPKKGSAKECSNWIQKRQRNKRSNSQHSLDHRKSKRIPENIYFCFIDYAKAFDCVDHNDLVENSSRDGNTRPPDLPHEKSICRSRSNSQNWTWKNRLISDWERSKSRLHIVTLLT